MDTPFGSTFVRFSPSSRSDAIPLVLLHPLAGTSISWHPVIAALVQNRPVYSLDTIGTAGRSRQSQPIQDGKDFASWFDAVLKGLALSRIHLAGYSNGAWHAGLIGIHAPDPLASLTLIEMSGGFTKVPLRTLAAFVRAGARPTSKNLARLNALVSPGVQTEVRERELASRGLKDFKAALPWPVPFSDAELQSIDIPTLALFGAASALSDTRRAADRVARLLPHAEVTVYPNAGHGLLFEHPDMVTARMRAFFADHDARVAP